MALKGHMKKSLSFLLLGAVAILCMGTVATVTKYTGSFYGTHVGLDSGITNSAGSTIDQRATNAANARLSSGVAAQATHATNADLATLATTAITSTNVQGFTLMTNNLVAVALVEQTNALGYVTNTYLTYTTNAFHYLGQ